MSNPLLKRLKADGWLMQKNAIGGAWRDADSGETHDVTDPASGEVIGTIAWAGAAETKAAIDAAQAAFKGWSTRLAGDRAAALHRMAAVIRENVDSLATMLTLEQGKPLSEARGRRFQLRLPGEGPVASTFMFFRSPGGQARRHPG